jgi:hypothetical protein
MLPGSIAPSTLRFAGALHEGLQVEYGARREAKRHAAM